MKKIIHINRQIIQHNGKYDKQLPVCRMQEGDKIHYAMEIKILGPSEMVYRPESPQPCGAKLWIETDASVELLGEVPWNEIKENMRLK